MSRTALFIRSSAKLGIWAGLAGAAVNCYYYNAFANVVVAQGNFKVKKWKLYKWTKRYTVDDGALAGAAVGLAASIPTLFMRSPAIPRWARCLGMSNIGACTGLLSAHGYLQYNGERQKAYKRLDRRLKRRSLEFWAIFWDKELMARFDPIMQQYVRHNAIWYTQLLPDEIFERAEELDKRPVKSKKLKTDLGALAEEQFQELPYYPPLVDYAQFLQQIDVEGTRSRLVEVEAQRQDVLEEAEFILFIMAQQQYEFCHLDGADHDLRQRLMQEMHIVDETYCRLRNAAHILDIRLMKWRLALWQRAVWDTSASETAHDQVLDWTIRSRTTDFDKHIPTFSLYELEMMQNGLAADVRHFETLAIDSRYTKVKRERLMNDVEDGRALLSAADRVAFRLEKMRRTLESTDEQKKEEGDDYDDAAVVSPKVVGLIDGLHAETNTVGSKVDGPSSLGLQTKTKVDQVKVARQSSGSLEPGKP
jgi:hypothetical protein